jgi:heme O synthase-like polyprenyltransferase
MAFQWLLGDQLFSIPYFVRPTLTAVLVFVGSYLLAYRVEAQWYRHHRTRLIGAVKGAFAGLLVGFIGFIAYSGYLTAT